MKMRRGGTTPALAAAAVAAVTASTSSSSFISFSLTHVIGVAEADSSPFSGAIRGGRGGVSKYNKRRHFRRRPAILDSQQGNKIERWRDDERRSRLLLPHVTRHGKRRLQYDYVTLNHKKQSDYGEVSVSKVEGDALHFQTVPPTTTTASTLAAANDAAGGGEGSMETYGEGFGGGSDLFYPSFDIELYPDGACLNDGKQPETYTVQEGYTFDNIDACCEDWFIDELGCKEASLHVSSSSSSGGIGRLNPTPSPTSSTDWPTWPVEFDYDDDALDHVISPEGTITSSSSSMAVEEEGSLAFSESFESGDFSRNDWILTSSSPSTDLWEADQTAWAYDGIYAARPGVLSEPNSQSNLTISFEDIYALRHGGYLTFAIHASVSYPVDVLLFTINDNMIRTFDKVTGDEGEWEEVSVLLNAGEHRLTWSYQYLSILSETSTIEVDPRRGANSWVDAVKLRPYTGDVIIADDDGTTLSLTDGMAPFKLLADGDAYTGTMSYVAHTGDIDSSQGSADISWVVYVGPKGGVVTFAAFASIYSPRDVCEFSIDGVPQVVIAEPSGDEWEVHHVTVEPGMHVLKWKLIKNVAGLSEEILDGVDVPSEYQGYVKVDGIHLEDNSVPNADEEALTVSSEEIPNTTTTITTTTTVAPISSGEPLTTTTTTTTKAIMTSTTTTEEPATAAATTTSANTTPTTFTDGPNDSTSESDHVSNPTSTTTTTSTEEPSDYTSESELSYATSLTADTEFNGCPSDLFSVEGLPGCCVEEPTYLGDGACDPREPYNTEACAFDLGDCCHDTCDLDSAYGCITKEGGEFGPFGFFCIDPRFATIDKEKCQVENPEWIGDGGCDTEGGYNTPECGWDGGDCCEKTCDPEFSFYPCGVNQPYTCMDPGAVSNETSSVSNPSVVNKETRSISPLPYHDGFESGTFDPILWDIDDGDAAWKVEDIKTAVEGNNYVAAHTADIVPNFGKAVLKHSIKSSGGGVLTFDIQASVQIPFDDVIIMIDNDVVAEFASATEGWEKHELDITAGSHLVQWIHRKNPSNMLEADLTLFGYPDEGVSMIDNIAFKPL